MKTKRQQRLILILAILLCLPAIAAGYLYAEWLKTETLRSESEQQRQQLNAAVRTQTDYANAMKNSKAGQDQFGQLMNPFATNQSNVEPANLPVWPDSKLIHRQQEKVDAGGHATAIRILPTRDMQKALNTYKQQAEALGFEKVIIKTKEDSSKQTLIMSKAKSKLILEFTEHDDGLKCMLHHTWF